MIFQAVDPLIDGACRVCGLQDKKKNKQDEKDNIKQQIQAENSGPSMRDIELSAINAKLLKDSLEVKSVISDGNCLYRYASNAFVFSAVILSQI